MTTPTSPDFSLKLTIKRVDGTRLGRTYNVLIDNSLVAVATTSDGSIRSALRAIDAAHRRHVRRQGGQVGPEGEAV